MKLYILNYLKALSFEPTEPTIAIRIFDPNARRYPDLNSHETKKYPILGQWDNCPEAPFDNSKYTSVHCYTFNDTIRDIKDIDNWPEKIRKNMINSQMAMKIINEFEKNYLKAEALMVHCYAGISRSVAVACALSQIFSIDFQPVGLRAQKIFEDENYNGNKIVFDTIMKASKR